MFTKRHDNDVNVCGYELKAADKLEVPFSTFVHSNRAALASCVRRCWCDPSSTKLLPVGCLLVVGGPDLTAIKLENGSPPIPKTCWNPTTSKPIHAWCCTWMSSKSMENRTRWSFNRASKKRTEFSFSTRTTSHFVRLSSTECHASGYFSRINRWLWTCIRQIIRYSLEKEHDYRCKSNLSRYATS